MDRIEVEVEKTAPIVSASKRTENKEKSAPDADQFLVQLYKTLAKASWLLNKYRLHEALRTLSSLPESQLNTVTGQMLLALIHFESVNYAEAERCFKKIRLMFPCILENMPKYSTTLWHLKKSAEMSHLAQDLMALDRKSTEAWCVLGNCYSLAKDHEMALKSFERAIQLSPRNAYAHNLAGHEHFFNEAYDKAQFHFRSALKHNPRLYNAWFGLGLVLFKQEKWALANYHFKQALEINRSSTILYTYLGMIATKTLQFEDSLVFYDRAIQLDPKNPQVRYRKSLSLKEIGRFPEAIKEMQEVISIAPKESYVHFKMGEIFKLMNFPDKALHSFLNALALDPKSSSTVRDAIERLHLREE